MTNRKDQIIINTVKENVLNKFFGLKHTPAIGLGRTTYYIHNNDKKPTIFFTVDVIYASLNSNGEYFFGIEKEQFKDILLREKKFFQIFICEDENQVFMIPLDFIREILNNGKAVGQDNNQYKITIKFSNGQWILRLSSFGICDITKFFNDYNQLNIFMSNNKKEQEQSPQETISLIKKSQKEVKGISGFLALFILSLIGSLIYLFLPTLVGITLMNARGGVISILDLDYVILLYILCIAGFIIYTIYSLIKIQPNAIFLAKAAIVIIVTKNLSEVLSVVYYSSSPVELNNLPELQRALWPAIIWFLYLKYSMRVKNTYPVESRKVYKIDKIILFLILLFSVAVAVMTFSNRKSESNTKTIDNALGEVERKALASPVVNTLSDNSFTEFAQNSDQSEERCFAHDDKKCITKTEKEIIKLIPRDAILREIVPIPMLSPDLFIGIYIKNPIVATASLNGYSSCPEEVRGQTIQGVYHLFTYSDTMKSDIIIPQHGSNPNDKLSIQTNAMSWRNTKQNNYRHFNRGTLSKRESYSLELEISNLINFKDYNIDGYPWEFVLYGGEYSVCGHDENLLAGFNKNTTSAILYKITDDSKNFVYWSENFIPHENGDVVQRWGCGDHGSETDYAAIYKYNAAKNFYYLVSETSKKCSLF